MLGVYKRTSKERIDNPVNHRLIKNIKLSAILLIIVTLLISNLNSYYNLKTQSANLTALRAVNFKQAAKLSEVTANIPKLQESYYEENLSRLFTSEELQALAKQCWKYTLTVNNIDVKDNIINLEDKNIDIVLSEAREQVKPLPQNVLASGSLSNKDKNSMFYSHIQIDSPLKSDLNIKNGSDTTLATYKFTNIPGGSVIALKVDEQLRERLQLSSDTITINIK